MSPVTAWLVGIFLAAPGPNEGEPQDEREARLLIVAEAINAETRSITEAALVARTVWEESGRLRRDVHAGTRRGDSGKAACLGQLHAQLVIPRAEWLTLTGTDLEATRRCIAATVRMYRLVGARCDRRGDGIAERMARRASAYATGRSCSAGAWSGARKRAWGALEWMRGAPVMLQPCSDEAPCAVVMAAPRSFSRPAAAPLLRNSYGDV